MLIAITTAPQALLLVTSQTIQYLLVK